MSLPQKAPDPVLPLAALEDTVASTASTVTRSLPPEIAPIPGSGDIVPTPEQPEIVPTPEPGEFIPIAELPEAGSSAPAPHAPVAAVPEVEAYAYPAQSSAVVPFGVDLLAIHDSLPARHTTAERFSVPSRSSSLEASSSSGPGDSLLALNRTDVFSATAGQSDPSATLGLSDPSATPSLLNPRPSPSLNAISSWAAISPTDATLALSLPQIDLARETLYQPGSQAQLTVVYWPNAMMAFRPTIVDRPPTPLSGMGSKASLPIEPTKAPATLPGNAAAAPITAPASLSLSNAGAPGSAAPNHASLTLVTAWRTLWRAASLRPPPVCLSSLTPPG